MTIVLHPVKYCKDAKVNLFSITNSLKNDNCLSNDKKKNIVISCGNGRKLVFDCRIKTRDGWVSGIDLIPVQTEVSYTITDKPNSILRKPTKDVNDLHQALGHPSEVITKLTGEAMGFNLVGEFHVCEACTIGKARQKNVPKGHVP